MKRKLYTKSHDLNILKEIDHQGGQFTAEEHAYAVEKEFGDTHFKTKDDLLRWYLQGNWNKLPSLSFLIEHIIKNRYQNVLSLGSGQCVLEYLLKLSLTEDVAVVASDFDAYFIKKAKQFFPEITAVTFDLFREDMNDLENKVKRKFDLAVFFFSAYVMDDRQLVNIFSGLKKSGVKEIVDFHAGYLDMAGVFRYWLEPLTKNNLLRRVFKKSLLNQGDYIGKFYGFARSRGVLRSLYKESGLEIVKETSVGDYKYVAILK